MIELHVTFASAEEAASLGRRAVEKRLAACVNILPGIRSVYAWQGEIEDESEVLALFKTADDRAEALETFLGEHHPYDTPAIIRHNARATAAYEKWLAAETRDRTN